jgi:hypothetical protein
LFWVNLNHFYRIKAKASTSSVKYPLPQTAENLNVPDRFLQDLAQLLPELGIGMIQEPLREPAALLVAAGGRRFFSQEFRDGTGRGSSRCLGKQKRLNAFHSVFPDNFHSTLTENNWEIILKSANRPLAPPDVLSGRNRTP